MNGKEDVTTDRRSRPLWRALAAVSVLLYSGTLIVLYFVDLKTVFEPPLLLFVMNTIFAGLIPIAVSIIAARGYLFSGSGSLLYMGCGMLTFGCGAAMAAWPIDGRQVPNAIVTIMNTGAFLGSALHLLGARLILCDEIPEPTPERRMSKLLGSYSVLILVVLLLTLATRRGMTPLFFIQGAGPTLLRQIVLGAAAAMFLLSALVSMSFFRKRKIDFHYWYSLALIMIALGLIAFFIQRIVGSPIAWLGRLGEYAGGIFALIAMLTVASHSRIRNLSIGSAVVDLFQDVKLSYQTLLETVTDPIVSFDSEGRILHWNRAAETVFGYREDEAIGASILDLAIDESSLEDFRKKVDDSRTRDGETELGRPMEVAGKTKAGAVLPMEVATSAMQARGRWAFICVFRDISERARAEAAIRKINDDLERRVVERTAQLEVLNGELRSEIAERKKTEEELRQSESRLRKITDIVFGVVYEYRLYPDGRSCFPYSGTGMNDIYEVTPEEVREDASIVFGRIHPDDLKRISDAINESARTLEDFHCELRMVLPRQGLRWRVSHARPERLPDGSTLWYGTITDITERKRAATELERLRTAIEQVGESTVITDLEGTILFVNPAFEAATGYSRQEAIGQNPRIVKSGKQDEAFYREMWETISSGRTWKGRMVNRKKDGSLHVADTIISPVRGVDGRVINYVAVKRDVTEALRLEEELRQSQKMESVGRLAGGVAHDFNNILTAINGYTGFALAGMAEGDSRRADLEEVLTAGQRATRLTRQLLAFSRKQILKPEVLDINGAVGGIVNMLKRLIGEDIKFVTHFVAQPCLAKVDAGQIEQVFLNLAVNARDAMPKGGTLTFETGISTPTEDFSLRHPDMPRGSLVCLSVRDTGCGMTDEVKARLFEPFFTTKEKGKGTGLGLAMVYGIIKQSGGDIEIETAPDRGTTFRIYLPEIDVQALDKDKGKDKGKDKDKYGTPQGNEAVLLVEDEESIRRLGARALTANGYFVLTASDGQQALKVLERYGKPVDLLITDVVMPGMSGRELAQVIAKKNLARRTLFVSGYTDDAIVQHGVLEPGLAFLNKPFTPNDLLLKLRQVLDGPADKAKA